LSRQAESPVGFVPICSATLESRVAERRVAELWVAELSGERLPQCGIERGLPGAGKRTPEQLKAVSQISRGVLRQLRPEMQWVHSYVTDDKMDCVYLAMVLLTTS
jgi:hypothetical protein